MPVVQGGRDPEAEDADLLKTLRAVPDGYRAWLDKQEAQIDALPAAIRGRATLNIARCREAERRIVEGIDILAADAQALKAFRLANRAMYVQAAWGKRRLAAHLDSAADETVPFDQAVRLATALRDHGVPATLHAIEGGFHNLTPDIDPPWGSDPWTDVAAVTVDFLQRTLGPAQAAKPVADRPAEHVLRRSRHRR